MADRRFLPDSSDPFSYLRVVVALLLAMATLVALGLAVSGVAPRAILLVSFFWGIYGLFYAVVDGVLEPLIEFGGRVLMDVGLTRERRGWSAIETMVAQGHHELAAASYGMRAREERSGEAAIRQAQLLAGPLGDPARAVQALDSFRDEAGRRLSSRDDVVVGLLLAELYERDLSEPGRALVELRRLLERHPRSPRRGQIRDALNRLKGSRFPTSLPERPA